MRRVMRLPISEQRYSNFTERRFWIIPLAPTIMSSPQKIGGEYGEVRANIDVERLNAYLAKHTPGIKGPVDVKQFKVCRVLNRDAWMKCL